MVIAKGWIVSFIFLRWDYGYIYKCGVGKFKVSSVKKQVLDLWEGVNISSCGNVVGDEVVNVAGSNEVDSNVGMDVQGVIMWKTHGANTKMEPYVFSASAAVLMLNLAF